jgi:hypothetical protein
MAIKMGREYKPHTIKVVYVDLLIEPTIYHDVTWVFHTMKETWVIEFADGRYTYINFERVLRIETLEPTNK